MNASRHGRWSRTHRPARDTGKRRFHFSIWGRNPGYGYESGWTFARTPALAVEGALKDASKYSSHKWKLPANVYLQESPEEGRGESFAFYVSSDGTITEGQGPSRDTSRGRSSRSSEARDAPTRTWRLTNGRWYHPSFGMAAKRPDGWYGLAPGVRVGPFKSASGARNALGHAVTKRGGRRDPSSDRLAKLDAELGYARTEYREWARRGERLTRDEWSQKTRALDKVRKLEHERERLIRTRHR